MKHIMKKAPMGWNSYDYYDTTVTEAEVKANAAFMAKHLRQAGWEYIIVDIEWYAKDAGTQRKKYQYIPFGEIEMDEYGRLQPAPNRFPSAAGGKGFGPVADYVHGLGLKFGIHIMRGIPREAAHRHLPIFGSKYCANEAADPSSICKWNPDMYGLREKLPGDGPDEASPGQAYYDSIIGMYADWGVDFIKCDDICNTNLYVENPYSAAHEVEMLHRAIEKTGRDIVLSLSPGPALIEKAWHYEKYAHMWRITDDFWDNWELLLHMFERCELWQNHVEEGSYPDCDMLPLGKLYRGFGGERDTYFTQDEQKTMMTLWCMFGSPLMIGAELTKLDDWTLSLLRRTEILKLTANDYVGRQVERDANRVVWSCRNAGTGERYLALFNLESEMQELTFDLQEAEQFRGMECADLELEELWDGERAGTEGTVLRSQVPGHGVKLFRLF